GLESVTSTRAEKRFAAALSRRSCDFLPEAVFRLAAGGGVFEAGLECDCALNLLAAPRHPKSVAGIARGIFRRRSRCFTEYPSLAYSTDRKYSQNDTQQIFLLGRAFQRCERERGLSTRSKND